VNYWTGEEGREFESEFATACGCKYAVATANGTVALEAALRTFGIGPGDDVITSSRTFIASASSIVMAGANPVFADVDLDSGNITANTIEAVLTPRTRAIIAVHLGGWPCNMSPILRVAQERNLFVVEDCAQAFGAMYEGRPVGSFGHAAAFSFCQDKIITTLGEGGMLTTSDAGVWERAFTIRDHGRNAYATKPSAGKESFRWIHDSIGTNWRLTEVQATVGRLQLRKSEEWVKKRQYLATTLAHRIGRIEALRVPIPAPSMESAYYRFYAYVRPEHLRRGWDRDRIIAAINAEGIPCFVGSCSEVYREKAFSGMTSQHRRAAAQELGDTSLAFLAHPTLDGADIDETCLAVEKVMAEASI
jgi:hypothetical protein